MAAKPVYKIPYGLDESYGNMEIALQTSDGSVGKVIPLKVIGMYLGSALLLMYLLLHTFVGRMAAPWQIVVFIVLWVLMTVLLASYDKTRRMNIQLVPTLMNYLPRGARHVYTRTTRSATDFYNISMHDHIDEDGLVYFNDGTYGYWYRVVGSASVLLFDSDREAIINRVDNFYRKWDQESEICFMTTKESQKVYRQVAHLKRQYEGLRNDDPDLRELAEEQFRILREHVGKEFKSIHQYMLIKSNNKEALQRANNILQSEVESSNLMIKQCVPLDMTDLYPVVGVVYQK